MDILHSANPVSADSCDAASSRLIEDEAEKLFDDGVFPIFITHNQNNYPTSDCCLVRSPSDIPKVFSVGAIQPDDTADYHDWDYAPYSNRGGGDTANGFLTRPEALSMVDLVASGFPGHATDATGNYGVVEPDGICFDTITPAGLPIYPADPGTSYAGPQVAGAAAQVLDYFLENG